LKFHQENDVTTVNAKSIPKKFAMKIQLQGKDRLSKIRYSYIELTS